MSGGRMSGGRMSGGRLSGGLMSGGLMSAHREEYTVRGSIAHAARVVTSIYIVANGNDHVMRKFT